MNARIDSRYFNPGHVSCNRCQPGTLNERRDTGDTFDCSKRIQICRISLQRIPADETKMR